MPSTSDKQHRFMEAVAHSSSFAKEAGVSQKVGKDFARADNKAGITKTHNGKPARTAASAPRSADEHMAARKSQGLSHREVAGEFGKPKSTTHRKVTNMMRNGFTPEGSAR